MTDNNKINNLKKVILGMAQKPMLIQKQMAKELLNQYDAVASSVLQNETLTKEHIKEQKHKTAIKIYNAAGNIAIMNGATIADTKIEKNSVAVVPVMGAMMRDDYCTMSEGYVKGTRSLEQMVRQLDANENVDGIVFQVNTPGGEAFGNESLSKAIKATETPTVVSFEMMASAGVFSFQGADEIYAVEKNSLWGSIGTYITLVDDSEFMQNMGIDFIEIYADDSTEKNRPTREALAGNQEPMKDFLNTLNDTFIKDVKNSAPNIKDDGSVFKGKLYTATEARKIGAIDGIKSLDFAVQRARYLSRHHDKREKRKKRKSKSKNLMQQKEEKLGFFARMFGDKSANEAEQDVQAVEAKIAEMKSENSQMQNELQTAKADVEKLTAANSEMLLSTEALKAEIETLKAEKTEMQEKLDELANVSAENEALKAENAKVIEHNKELGGLSDAQLPQDVENSTSHKQGSKAIAEKRTYQDIINALEDRKK